MDELVQRQLPALQYTRSCYSLVFAKLKFRWLVMHFVYAALLFCSTNLLAVPRVLIQNDPWYANQVDQHLNAYLLNEQGEASQQSISVRAVAVVRQGLGLLHEAYYDFAERGFDIFDEELAKKIEKADEKLPPGYASFYVALYDYAMTELIGFARVLMTKKHELTFFDGEWKSREGGTESIGFESDFPDLKEELETVRYEVGRVWTISDGPHRTDFLAEIYNAVLQTIYHQNKRHFNRFEGSGVGYANSSAMGVTITDSSGPTSGSVFQLDFSKMFRGMDDMGVYAEAGKIHSLLYQKFGLRVVADHFKLKSKGINVLGTGFRKANQEVLEPYRQALKLLEEGKIEQLEKQIKEVPLVRRAPFYRLLGKLALEQGDYERAAKTFKRLHKRHRGNMHFALNYLIACMGQGNWVEAQKTAKGLEKRFSELGIERAWGLSIFDRNSTFAVDWPGANRLEQQDAIADAAKLVEMVRQFKKLEEGDLFAYLKLQSLFHFPKSYAKESEIRLSMKKLFNQLQPKAKALVDFLIADEEAVKRSLDDFLEEISQLGLLEKTDIRSSNAKLIVFRTILDCLNHLTTNYLGLAKDILAMDFSHLENLESHELNRLQLFAGMLSLMEKTNATHFWATSFSKETFLVNQITPTIAKALVKHVTLGGRLGPIKEWVDL